jgi:TfoX/Sxy family transcriptional regulator of competence genes
MNESDRERIRELEMALGAALQAVKPEAQLSWKSMFGGAAYYANGVIFAAWFGEGLALKLPEAVRDELMRVDGAVKPWAKEYVQVPPTFLDDTTLLEPWVERSVDYVTTPKKRKRR